MAGFEPATVPVVDACPVPANASGCLTVDGDGIGLGRHAVCGRHGDGDGVFAHREVTSSSSTDVSVFEVIAYVERRFVTSGVTSMEAALFATDAE